MAVIWLLPFTCLKIFLDDIMMTMHLHAVTTTGYSGSTRFSADMPIISCPQAPEATTEPFVQRINAQQLYWTYSSRHLSWCQFLRFYSTRENSFSCSKWHCNGNKHRSHLELRDAFLKRIFKLLWNSTCFYGLKFCITCFLKYEQEPVRFKEVLLKTKASVIKKGKTGKYHRKEESIM